MKNLVQIVADAFALKKSKGVPQVNEGRAERKTIYVRQNANGYGAGSKRLIDSETNKVIGVTNIENKNMLPGGKKYLVMGVRLAIATNADADVKTADYGASKGLPQFVNGEIKIEQDGTLQTLPLRDILVTPGVDDTIIRSNQFYPVLPFEIGDGSIFNLEVEPVGAIAVDHCFEVAFDIVEVATSSKTQNSARFC